MLKELAFKDRNIVEEALFAKQLAEIEPNVVRADEFIDGAKHVLSREAKMGTQVGPNSCIWFLPMKDVPEGPPLILYYTFDDQKVYSLSVQVAP